MNVLFEALVTIAIVPSMFYYCVVIVKLVQSDYTSRSEFLKSLIPYQIWITTIIDEFRKLK